MEDWKLQTIITNFEESAEHGAPSMLCHAKMLARAFDLLGPQDWKQQREVIERMEPIMDHGSAPARQMAALIIMRCPISKLSMMPNNLDIQLFDDRGKEQFHFQWDDTKSALEQQTAWMDYVVKHKIYLEDQKESGRG